MALQAKGVGVHNQMLGTKIRHPPSTNFDDDGFKTPVAKRLKRLDSTDSSPSRRDESGEDDDAIVARTTPPLRREIPDSEAETDEEVETLAGALKTDLETTLPPIKTDKEAIAAYEATRAAGSAELDLHGRLGQRKWIQGKSSIYVDAFNLALGTVLEEESHLFDEAETELFNVWKDLSYEGQYLWVSHQF